MPERRVVITGMGVVTPVGNDLETFWSNLKTASVVSARSTRLIPLGTIAKSGDKSAISILSRSSKVQKTCDAPTGVTHFAMAAAKMAVADSGIDVVNLNERDRFGVIVGTGIGGLKTLQDQLRILLTKDQIETRLSPSQC